MSSAIATPAIVMLVDPEAPQEHRDRIDALARQLHLSLASVQGDGWAALSAGDGTGSVPFDLFSGLPGVLEIRHVTAPFRLASREVSPTGTTVQLHKRGSGGPRWRSTIGATAPIVAMARPKRSIANRHQLWSLGETAARLGFSILDVGDAPFRSDRAPRIDPGAFSEVAEEVGVGLSVEVSDPRTLHLASELADVLQVPPANMQNFSLLRELGRLGRPVILRRAPGATLEEFLLAAEYILGSGNGRVILCEGATTTFDAVWNPRFEINAIALLRELSHLPVAADLSQGSLDGDLVGALARAAVAAGADGLVLPIGRERGPSSTEPIDEGVEGLDASLRRVAAAVDRSL